MIIQHNMSAMFTKRQYDINSREALKNSEKLASGYRINRAADDAAGLAISEKMRTQIRGLAKGVQNTQEGISLCHVADGALNEVHDMLHRLKELSVQAANDTNCNSDRGMVQEEVRLLLEEIDRIGNTTEFNTMALFKGGTKEVKVIEGTNGGQNSVNDIPFSDFALMDVDLGKKPIIGVDKMNMLHLQAVVNNKKSEFYGESFNLIFGNGNTSNPSIRVTTAAGTEIVDLSDLTVTSFQQDSDTSWSKTATYTDGTTTIGITQKISLEDTSDTEKNYVISYEFTQTADVTKLEFMFHADTAYNNNDTCEGYYIDGKRVDNYCVYGKGNSLVGGANSNYLYDQTPPNSFSIVDIDNALAFSEKVSFASGEEPDSLSIGHYSTIDDWYYYNNLNSNLGKPTNKKDLGFSLYYDLSNAARNNTVTFKYGIISTESDANITGNEPEEKAPVVTIQDEKLDLWIQSGALYEDGMFLTIDKMNTKVLGIDNLDISTKAGAEKALDAIDSASGKISVIRSKIGAQQNRLEHTILSKNNSLENLTAAESRIRDADFAKEMVENAKRSIMEQASSSFISQANKMPEMVLQLLSA